ncbi:PREDICTED: cytoskeleton-associated protein 5 isoform X2 [Rhagoletis zephyria]|uniref:cytoskeleton-associated protein 5 isoform X2 n=1 Tax=Rhagoletis zephyria TaxID=28612 RepID=UPI0008113D54|nr:PREDICTED: cytoskeleton-associated protein 5 isoform X2 [Rhagoletis zephyria]
MTEDTEYKKLPVDERCVHKLWKARVDGYEEAAKIFREIDDEKSPEWMKFLGLIKKMVVDSNVVAQEKGLEAALIFVENCGQAGKTVGDVMAGIVQKCIAAPKAKTKDLAVQITLMYIEIEKQEAVIEELVKGMEHKNPKIVAACVSATTLALRDFGNKVVSVKPMIKKLAPLMSDRDKTVRDEGKQLAIEIYRWIGAAMKPQITSLPQVTLKELEDEFDKLKGEKAEPIRYLKSQQEKQQQISAAAAEHDEAGDDEDGEGEEAIDPMDLIDPVDILSKMPKDFYDKLEEKKWTLRKESLEALEKLLTENPKLENGEYGVLVSTLKKVITKDTNVVLVAMAGKCLAMLANGLGKRFGTYAMACVPSLLEKFKEKKANVVAALRESMDAIYPSTNLEAMQECIVESLGNKNPNVKSETAFFLARAFARTQPTALNKKLLKLYVTTLIKTLNEPDPTVRDASAEALGTLLKLMGEKSVGPFLIEVDALKMAKIKECQEKAEIKIKVVGVKKERPATAPASKTSVAAASSAGNVGSGASSRSGSTEPKSVSRPATAGGKKSGVKRVAGGGSAAPLSKSASSAKVLATERELPLEEVQAKAEELLPPDVLSGLIDTNWKNRLAACENLLQTIGDFDAKQTGLSQTLVRTVSARKPGLKEMNFQVLKHKLDIIRIVAETYPLTTTTTDLVVNEVTEKLADIKNGATAADVLTAFAEATKLEHIVGRVLTFAFDQKSPKVQSEALNWVSKAILEFGFQLQPKLLLEDVRKAVQSTNPTVRGAAICLLGTMSLYMGSTLMMFFENEKPALKSQIQTELDKSAGEKPPKPVRGVKKSAGNAGGAAVDAEDDACDEDEAQEQMNLADMLPRIDIAPQITETLLKEMSDKDWKTRNEGLNKLQTIILEAKLIKPTIGDLAPALAHRLLDSNAKIAQTAMSICEQLANAMGSSCKNHVRTLFPGFLHALGDNKPAVRAAALSCINSFGEKGGYKEFFESEMIADALKTGSPALKSELWGWLAERMPQMPPKSISKEELTSMVPHLYAHICDRNVDVRKNANEAVLGIMIHLGFESMVKALDKQKPASKKDIQAALDKARPNLPMKPLPKGKQQAPIEEPTKKVVRGGGGGAQKNAAAKGGAAGAGDKTGAASSRKKEEDVDTSPLLAVNNSKNQRLIDEQKMRVLKWTFTTPREEFIELLREQMTTANVNKGLMANMFHDDFRYHLKVIEALNEDLPNNNKALVCNLDLILKWLSLRFYDTNPSVLLKGLEYLNLVFQTLVETEYILAENEGSAFIPHLLLKLGDPKDAVRVGVRSLLRQILLVYPYTKVFVYVMDGLKSKNARQRTECLDELGYLIENYGLTVCQPSQQVALKEIARHISDRDNSVRNAALNCVVQAYFLAGEKVYKLIGQLNEKDLSMLDERIKRAKKTRKPAPAAADTTTALVGVGGGAKTSAQVVQQDSIEIDEPATNGACDELPPPDEQPTPAASVQLQSNANEANASTEAKDKRASSLIRQATFDQPATTQYLYQPSKPSGPFGLDPDVISEIEKGWVRVDQMQSVEVPRVDVSLLFEPIKIIPTRDGVQYPQEKFEQLISRSHYMQQAVHNTPPPPSAASSGGIGSPYMSPQQHLHHQQQLNAAVYGSGGGGGGGVSCGSSGTNIVDVLPKHDPQLIKMIKAISSADTLKARAAISELAEIIDSPEKQAVLRDYEEIFIQNVLAQFKNLSQVPITESLVVYQPLLSILYSFFHSKTLGKTLSVAYIKNLMSALLNLMADQKLNTGDDGQYNKVINGICLKVLDKANFTNLNCALIRLLRETCPEAGLPKFTDLLMKCIWRNVKMLPERTNELNYDAVILEVHEFMLALPSSWWQTRPSDTPLRTVKTIIHNMAKVKGNAILNHLNQIPTHSELHTYLIKILKNLAKEGHIPSASPQRSGSAKDVHGKRISNQTHETMSQIFKLISDKETKQQGLLKLYEFKVQNPDIDLTTFLKGASPSFQKYIEDGLAEIERAVAQSGDAGNGLQCTQNGDNRIDANFQHQTTAASGLGCSSGGSAGGVKTADPDFWMDRLNHLLSKANLGRNADGMSGTHSMLMDNKVADENLNLNTMNAQQKMSSLIRRDASKPELSPNRLQHLQAKLAVYKKENHA